METRRLGRGRARCAPGPPRLDEHAPPAPRPASRSGPGRLRRHRSRGLRRAGGGRTPPRRRADEKIDGRGGWAGGAGRVEPRPSPCPDGSAPPDRPASAPTRGAPRRPDAPTPRPAPFSFRGAPSPPEPWAPSVRPAPRPPLVDPIHSPAGGPLRRSPPASFLLERPTPAEPFPPSSSSSCRLLLRLPPDSRTNRSLVPSPPDEPLLLPTSRPSPIPADRARSGDGRTSSCQSLE